MSRNVKKLKVGDPGFDASVDKFEVSDQRDAPAPRIHTYSIDEINQKIDRVKARKAREITRFDSKIQILEDLKADVLKEA